MAFDDYLKEHIFEPLGMVDTDFWVTDDKADRLAANYIRQDHKLVQLKDNYLRKPLLLSGAGAWRGRSTTTSGS